MTPATESFRVVLAQADNISKEFKNLEEVKFCEVFCHL
jgi:hypothetical protein